MGGLWPTGGYVSLERRKLNDVREVADRYGDNCCKSEVSSTKRTDQGQGRGVKRDYCRELNATYEGMMTAGFRILKNAKGACSGRLKGKINRIESQGILDRPCSADE